MWNSGPKNPSERRAAGESRSRPKYKLTTLLALCEPDSNSDPETRRWLDDPPRGRELI